MNDQAKLEAMKENVTAMVGAPSCCPELRAAGQNWLEAIGTDREAAAAKALVAEAKADLMSIEAVHDLFISDRGKEMFGPERAAAMAAHAEQVMREGGRYCDCGACTGARIVIENEKDFVA